ncbi:GNAT family N-acetyltransferase [Alteribacter natronophilus]|uniref:GNAT family N-acetyltransferase n=1 Tax=Alteribacter natronophilus TaxID=2583810 RepID=UPI00110D4F4D|nr:GNAT family N-acetyltransferase [Alteribacter natronophilus]TMW71253.1 GNAT family N-acetyltransferase [Alteribacter natronophilus]
MTTLTLKTIDRTNWEDAVQLKVHDEQKRFVASNLYSIAQAQFLDRFTAKGIYLGETMIGFALYGIDEDDDNYWIYRLMIDGQYQGNAHGYEALRMIVKEMEQGNTDGRPCVMLSYEPENHGARHVYGKAGFKETEMASWGEQMARYDFVK